MIAAANLESSNTIFVDFQLPNDEHSGNLESKIADLEAIQVSNQNMEINELNIQKQQLTSSIAEMRKNYAILQEDNQMWKQCKSLVDARVKFEKEEVNVLRSAYADKLRESSELNLELRTCQNQLETTQQTL